MNGIIQHVAFAFGFFHLAESHNLLFQLEQTILSLNHGKSWFYWPGLFIR